MFFFLQDLSQAYLKLLILAISLTFGHPSKSLKTRHGGCFTDVLEKNLFICRRKKNFPPVTRVHSTDRDEIAIILRNMFLAGLFFVQVLIYLSYAVCDTPVEASQAYDSLSSDQPQESSINDIEDSCSPKVMKDLLVKSKDCLWNR